MSSVSFFIKNILNYARCSTIKHMDGVDKSHGENTQITYSNIRNQGQELLISKDLSKPNMSYKDI